MGSHYPDVRNIQKIEMMKRRKAMKVAAGVIAGSGAGLFALTSAFKPESPSGKDPSKLDYDQPQGDWNYLQLDPDFTGALAYDYYSEGSCMYATVKSVISQLAGIMGDPYGSFPYHLFKYGHGGVGGYGTICGALNGAAALIGLFITDKMVQDRMIADVFQWYEKEPIPKFSPHTPIFDFTPPATVSNSVLCHASNTSWCNETGYQIGSNERKERCRRLTGDVAKKLTVSLNEIFADSYITNAHINNEVNTCLACHGNEGKLKNSAGQMNCNSCHTESVGHRVFADAHYKVMKE